MESDRQLIQSAYEEAIKKLYANLFDHYVMAAGDDALAQEADRHFTTGVGLARSARDRAIALLT